MKIFTQSVYILCRDHEKFVQLLLDIFFMLKIVRLLLETFRIS